MYEFPISKVNYLKDEDWKKYGACYGADGEVFFPSNGRPSNESFKFCENCLVRPRCAVDGTISEALGIWGGLVGTEREKALETKQFRKKLFLKILSQTASNEKIQEWLEYSREISSIDDKDDRVEVIRELDDITPLLLNKISILYFIYGIEESDGTTDEEILKILESHNIIMNPDCLSAVHEKVLKIIENKRKVDVKNYLNIKLRLSGIDDADSDDYNYDSYYE